MPIPPRRPALWREMLYGCGCLCLGLGAWALSVFGGESAQALPAYAAIGLGFTLWIRGFLSQ
ncbi:MAG: hypothetical protein INF43_01065 [Alphaproteobacteria bacterium]|nr:hypothetical protein [Alphaproteobacteria bacterium]